MPTVKELNEERSRLTKERQVEYPDYGKIRAKRIKWIRTKQNADVILKKNENNNIEG